MPNRGQNKNIKYIVIDEDTGQKELFRSIAEMAQHYGCSYLTMFNTIKDKQRGVWRNSFMGRKMAHKQIKEVPKEKRRFFRPLGDNYKLEDYEKNKDAYVDFFNRYVD